MVEITRSHYRRLYGPTAGDRVRLADTDLLIEVERDLCARGARLLLVETSSRPDYENTRAFYSRCGYTEAARIRDFYAPADDRIMLTTRLTTRERGAATR